MNENKFEALRYKLENEIVTSRGEFSITDEAYDLSKEMYKKLCDEFEELPNKPVLESYWSRIQTHILKIAMILKISEKTSDGDGWVIDKDAYLRGHSFMQSITKYYKYLMSKIPLTRGMKKEIKVQEILEAAKGEGIQHSKLLVKMHMNSKHFKDLINTMTEKGRIRTLEKDTRTKKMIIYYAPKYFPGHFNI